MSETRIAIVDPNKCKPKKCNQECKRNCPVVMQGKNCIEVKNTSKISYISESLCNGCGICVKKCPFDAIKIIKIPTALDKDTIHRYGENGFKLHRLPMPKKNNVVGLVGRNGTGKSTALKILAGKIMPNFGQFDKTVEIDDLIKYYRGSDLQNYFINMKDPNFKVIIKPQYVDMIPKLLKTDKTVLELLVEKDEKGNLAYLIKTLELDNILNNQLATLSGGELQRFAIAIAACQNANVYMFDEPTSYLDVKQRLKASHVIRSLLNENTYVIVVEHDLSILDYMSDFISVLYGEPSAWGVITLPHSVREGINMFLSGYIPVENMRFRKEELTFKITVDYEDTIIKNRTIIKYPKMSKTLSNFKLHIEEGVFNPSEITVLLGENGTGKSTLIKLLAGKETFLPDEKEEELDFPLPKLKVAYKPQKISISFEGSVRDFLQKKIGNKYLTGVFQSEIYKPLEIDNIIDQEVQNLSGGELQRVIICVTLGQEADLYLIDEPSAYLDAEQRMNTAKIIKRFIMNSKKTAIVVEHDFIMSTYLADKVIVYDGIPAVNCIANTPESLKSGMNKFLSKLDVTFRRDIGNWRPRINKPESTKDREQKESGNYFY